MIAETKSGKSCFSVKTKIKVAPNILFFNVTGFFLSETMRLEE